MRPFDNPKIWHVPREENVRADILSKLASTKTEGNSQSLMQETLKSPSIVESLPTLAIEGIPSWMSPIIQFLRNGTHLEDSMEAKRLTKEASYYTIIDGRLYRKGLSQPLLKCLGLDQIIFILEEVYEGSYGHHLRRKVLALKVLRAGYYWPSMARDSIEHMKKCPMCQKNAPFHVTPAKELSSIMSPWPFSKWAIDLLDPFHSPQDNWNIWSWR